MSKKISEQLNWGPRKTGVLAVVAHSLLRALPGGDPDDVNRIELVSLGLDMSGTYERIVNAMGLPEK